jgi:MFS family permease
VRVDFHTSCDRPMKRSRRAEEQKTSRRARTGSAPPRPGSSARAVFLPRSVIIIGLVSLLGDISSEMIYPVLPLFLTATLGAPATVVGLIEGIAVGASQIVTGFSGWISDRIGRRKPVAFVGYALTAIARPVIAAAGAWPVVLVARFAERFGRGIRVAPRDAMLAESIERQSRGRAFGFERAMDSGGAVLGPLVALALVGWTSVDARSIFLFSAIPAALAALLILEVREKKDAVSSESSKIKFSLAGTTRDYKVLLLISGVFGLGNSANAFLILRAQQLGVATSKTILAYALYNAVASLASMPAGSASDKFGRRNLLVLGYAIYALAYAGFGAADRAWMIWPLFAVYGLFPSLTDSVGKALAVDTAGKAGKATAVGAYSSVAGITQVLASYIGGVLWDKIDPAATFYLGAALAGLAVVLLIALLPPRSRA